MREVKKHKRNGRDSWEQKRENHSNQEYHVADQDRKEKLMLTSDHEEQHYVGI